MARKGGGRVRGREGGRDRGKKGGREGTYELTFLTKPYLRLIH